MTTSATNSDIATAALLGRTVAYLRETIPNFEPTRTTETLGSRIAFPTPDGADHAFAVWIYEGAEPQIAATTLDRDESWVSHYEIDDYDSAEHQADTFFRDLTRILTSTTSIVVLQNFLTRSVLCTIDGEQIGTCTSRLSPSFRRSRRVYTSPALVPVPVPVPVPSVP